MDIKRWLLISFFGVLAAIAAPLLLLLSTAPRDASAQDILTVACDFQSDLRSMKMVVAATQYEEEEGVSTTTVIRQEDGIRHILQTGDSIQNRETHSNFVS